MNIGRFHCRLDGKARGVVAMFKALSGQGRHMRPDKLDRLWKAMTPGGLNEAVIQNIRNADGFNLWTSALDRVMEHIR